LQSEGRFLGSKISFKDPQMTINLKVYSSKFTSDPEKSDSTVCPDLLYTLFKLL